MFSPPEDRLAKLADELVASHGKTFRRDGPLKNGDDHFYRLQFNAKDFVVFGYDYKTKFYWAVCFGEKEVFKKVAQLADFVRPRTAKGPPPPPPPERNAYVDLAYYLRRKLRPGYRIDGPLHDQQHDFFHVVWAPDPNSAQIIATFGNSKLSRSYFFRLAGGPIQSFEHKNAVEQFMFGELHVRGVTG